jgi:hypothetical protein
MPVYLKCYTHECSYDIAVNPCTDSGTCAACSVPVLEYTCRVADRDVVYGLEHIAFVLVLEYVHVYVLEQPWHLLQ